MLELSACIEWLFHEEPQFADRIRRASTADVGAVEFWTWHDKDLSAIGSALAETGAHLEAFVSQPEGQLVDPRTHDEFLAGVSESAKAAESFGCRNLIVLAGDRMPETNDLEQRRAVVAALRRAAPLAAKHGVSLVLEPLNSRVDHVGHFLDSTVDGLAIVEEVDEPNVRLLLDLYHSSVMDEHTDEIVGDRMELVGHLHLADAPGRHEPGTGRIDWPAIIDWLQRAGYKGRLGLEYQPTGDTSKTLAYITQIVTAHQQIG